jgi:hypothetical protein
MPIIGVSKVPPEKKMLFGLMKMNLGKSYNYVKMKNKVKNVNWMNICKFKKLINLN